jgi:non-specific serine/threonine protein kinase/serine/threonine-protein kinase
MEAERWERIKAVFQETFEHDPAERAAVLDTACGGDAALRDGVERLLRAHAGAAGFLDALPWLSVAAVPSSDEDDAGPAPVRIGPYRVERELGRGGMGTVYLAERDEPGLHKTVAIKVVRRGMDTEFVLRRFRTERQILAGLDHPGIARLYDGGTTEDGRPYFVMEYVAGETLLAYCDGRRLSLAERLRLFQRVCAAVQYAHQGLVVHRDLKPSNILVTPEGEPRLLDFGIAKVMTTQGTDEEAAATATVFRIMTPEYASPEQVRGERVTTASDVYSLGVILYELASGHRPYRVEGRLAAEVERVVLEHEPSAPSQAVGRMEVLTGRDGGDPVTVTPEAVGANRGTAPARLRRLLRGDLDTIVLTALHKDPARRYATPAELADDLGRHLDGLPVRARPDRWSYRATKFVRRHRVAVAAAAVAVASLAGGLGAAVWEARRAEQQRTRAERRFNDVRKLANAVMGELDDAIRDLPGSTPARRLLVTHALAYLDGLAREAAGDHGLQLDLAAAYEKVGDVQGRPTYANLGDFAGARRSYEKALSIRRALSALDPNAVGTQRALADTYRRLGRLLQVSGSRAEATADYEQAHSIATRLAQSHSQDLGLQELLAATHCDLAWHLAMEDAPRARGHAEAALVISERLVALRPGDFSTQERLAISLERVGRALEIQTPNSGAGLQRLQEAGAIWDTLLAADPRNTSLHWSVLANRSLRGVALRAKGDTVGALRVYGQGLGMAESLAASDPASAEYQSALATWLAGYAEKQLEAGLPSEAVANLKRAVAILEPLVRRAPTDHEVRVDLVKVQRALVNAQAAARRRPAG